MATVVIDVEVDESGAVQGTRLITDEFDKMKTGVERAGLRGNQVMQELSKQQRTAKDAAALLGREFGVQLPRQLETFLSKTRLVGPALALAFNTAVVVGLVAAFVALIPKIESAAQSLGGFTEKMRELNDELVKLNRQALAGFGTREAGQGLLTETNNRINALEKERDALFKMRDAALVAIGPQGGVLAIAYGRRISNINDELVQLLRLSEEQRNRLKELGPAYSEANKETETQTGSLKQQSVAIIDLNNNLLRMVGNWEAARKQLEDIKALKLEESLRELDESLGVPGAPAAGNINEQFAQLDALVGSVSGKLPLPPLFDEDQQRQVEALAQSIEQFFTQVFLTARSFGDAWKQFVQQLVRVFVSGISQMVARWIAGFSQMQGAAGAGAGGGLGGILGSIFGPLFGGGGGLFNFGGGAQTGIAGAGISGGGQTFQLQPGGLPAPTGLGGLGFLGSFLGSPLGGFLGPLGLLGGIGLISSLLDRSEKKKAARAALQRTSSSIQDAFNRFLAHEISSGDAFRQIDDLMRQLIATGAFKYMGARAGGLWHLRVMKQISEIGRIQGIRNRRQELMEELFVPEFSAGGFVNDVFNQMRSITSGQGKLLAYLHQGEAVLNAGAVQKLGPAFIQQANQAPGFAAGGMMGMMGSRWGNVTINISGAGDPRAVAREVKKEMERIELNR